MNGFRNILNDIKDKKYIESYIVLLVGVGLLIIDLIGNVEQSVINQVTLAILSTLIYVGILERREYSKLLMNRDINGIVAFRPDREKLPLLSEHLKTAKKEIAILAVQHSAIVHQYLGLLQQKAEAGCQIKLLMMAARGKGGKKNPNVAELEAHLTQKGMLPQLDSSIETFRKWITSLSSGARENIEIRAYLEFPVASYLFIDKDELDGYVQVEVFLYGVHVHNMPHYVVTKRDNAAFFQTHFDSFKKLWEKSIILFSE